VVDADAAAASLARAARFAAVTPLRVLAGVPLAAARRAAGRARRRALPPPPPPQPQPPAPPALGGLALPPLPSFLSRPARFLPAGSAPAAAAAPAAESAAPPPPRFAVRGWPWSLGLADGLESAAGWLRRATEEAARAGSGGGAACAANA